MLKIHTKPVIYLEVQYNNSYFYVFIYKQNKIVVKVTSLEPFNKKTVLENKSAGNDVYARLIHIMKESTFEYYNMRMALGMKIIPGKK